MTLAIPIGPPPQRPLHLQDRRGKLLLREPRLMVPGQKPVGPIRIDWSNRASNSCIFYAMFGHGRQRDVVSSNALTNNGATINPENADIDSSEYFSMPASDAGWISGPLSVVWIGEADSTANYQHFIGKHVSNGATNCPIDLSSNGGAFFLTRADVGGFSQHAGPPFSVGKVFLGLSLEGNGRSREPLWCYNGTISGAFGGNDAFPVTGSSANIRIGRRDDGVTQLDGRVSLVMAFSRALTGEEMKRLYLDPYQFLIPA